MTFQRPSARCMSWKDRRSADRSSRGGLKTNSDYGTAADTLSSRDTARTPLRCGRGSSASWQPILPPSIITSPFERRVKRLRAYINGSLSLESAAVSYTHLRAHETPEHLVCRLLLE